MSATATDLTQLDPSWTERLPYNFTKRATEPTASFVCRVANTK